LEEEDSELKTDIAATKEMLLKELDVRATSKKEGEVAEH